MKKWFNAASSFSVGVLRMTPGKNTGEEVVDPENMSEDDESNLPDAVTAQKLVHEFEGITNTDEALAQFYLQVKKYT